MVLENLNVHQAFRDVFHVHRRLRSIHGSSLVSCSCLWMVLHTTLFGASSGCQSGSLVYAACTRMVSEASWMITGCLPSGKGIEALLEASVNVEGFSIIAQVDYRTSSLFFRSEPWMLHSRTKEHSNVDRTYVGQTSRMQKHSTPLSASGQVH